MPLMSNFIFFSINQIKAIKFLSAKQSKTEI